MKYHNFTNIKTKKKREIEKLYVVTLEEIVIQIVKTRQSYIIFILKIVSTEY